MPTLPNTPCISTAQSSSSPNAIASFSLDTRFKQIAGQLQRREAMLAGVFTVLERKGILREVIQDVCEEQVGLKREQFSTWWREHRTRGKNRRRLEAHTRSDRRTKTAALAKLNDRERKLLRIKEGE